MGHKHYHIDGECYPSVTHITGSKPKPWLTKWRKKHGEALCDRKAAEANRVGTAFHSYVEGLIYGAELCLPTKRLHGMANSFKEWLGRNDFEPVVLEQKVYSLAHKYQGTLDAVGYLNGELAIVDWKTSSAIHSDMGLQLAAYAEAYKERHGVGINAGYIVLTSKDKPDYKTSHRRFDLTKLSYISEFIRLRRNLPPWICDGKDVVDLDSKSVLV
jgi:hypothetical protein